MAYRSAHNSGTLLKQPNTDDVEEVHVGEQMALAEVVEGGRVQSALLESCIFGENG